MNEKTIEELEENVAKAAKIRGEKIAKAFSIFNKNLGKAEGEFASFGKALGMFRPTEKTLKKKRGAGYTKKRICKRTGKSSSH